jgi:hypothetical protein
MQDEKGFRERKALWQLPFKNERDCTTRRKGEKEKGEKKENFREEKVRKMESVLLELGKEREKREKEREEKVRERERGRERARAKTRMGIRQKSTCWYRGDYIKEEKSINKKEK